MGEEITFGGQCPLFGISKIFLITRPVPFYADTHNPAIKALFLIYAPHLGETYLNQGGFSLPCISLPTPLSGIVADRQF